jgi:hypothetical protein
MNIKLRTIPLVVATAICFSMAVPSLAEAKSEIYKNGRGIAIKGNVEVKKQWQEDIPGSIKKADANWPGVLK